MSNTDHTEENFEEKRSGRQTRSFWSGLRGRTLLVMGLAYGIIALIALAALWHVGDGIARELGSAYAERLVLWHKERSASEVGRNLALARQLSENPSLIAWARNEDDPQKRERALEVLKSYRSRLDSSNYFLALADSGNYYFSQKGENSADGRPEHTLHRDDPQDAWFYNTLESDAKFHINVDVDEKLGVTKAWINVPIRAEGEALGLTGTGLELSRLVRNFTSSEKSGVTTMLLNRDGAIQIHPETSHIAFDTASRKDITNSLFNYVETEDGRERLNAALENLASGEERVAILSLNVEGKERLVAAAWMERLGWYTVAALDLNSILGWPEFLSLGGILAAAMTGLLIMLAFLINPLILRPIDRLSHAAAKVTEGDYSVRVPKKRSDELGTLSRGFNQMTSTLHDYTEDLEARVTERTREAEAARQYFESILENTPVGIAFLDGERRFRQVNPEFLRLLGYAEEDVLGRSPRFIYPDESTFQTIGEEAYPQIARGGTYRKDVDLQHADGSVFPCAMAGRAVNPEDMSQGYIWTLRDMTERVQLEEKLREMSFHDSLTGLYNRNFFEEEMKRLSDGRHNPLGIIACDLDGLKFLNDTLGHQAGDQMLVNIAKILRQNFRSSDIIARIGGDEFAVLLTETDPEVVELMSQRLRDAVRDYNCTEPEIPLSLSVGHALGEGELADMHELFREADNLMYREKIQREGSARSAILQALTSSMQARDFNTENHCDRLQDLAASLARSLNLSQDLVNDLYLLTRFHDLGKVGIPDQILFKPGPLTEEEWRQMRQHCEIGHRIASSVSDLEPIADFILNHHEWWDGRGYPHGLSGDDIPLPCRILAIVDAYDAMTSDRPYRRAKTRERAIAELRRWAGTQFDPELVEQFIQIVERYSF